MHKLLTYNKVWFIVSTWLEIVVLSQKVFQMKTKFQATHRVIETQELVKVIDQQQFTDGTKLLVTNQKDINRWFKPCHLEVI